jgi:DNA-binding response OmpR family regulator
LVPDLFRQEKVLFHTIGKIGLQFDHLPDALMSNGTILIVEDERAVARSLEYALDQEGFNVLLAETGQRALELARAKNPHLILLDIRLPDLSGFDVCKQLRAEGRRMPILMLTARDESVDKVLGLELGADDYIVKPYNLRELIARARAHIRRAYGELADTSQRNKIVFGEVELDLEALRVTRAGEPVFLTPIEFKLLRYLASHPDRPVSREGLVKAVWGYDSIVGSDRTVDVHIRHLRQKLEDDPANPQWITTVRGLGYVFRQKPVSGRKANSG